MKIVVIGLGSMGRRRIRLLQKNHPHITIVGVDSNTQRAEEVAQESGIKTYGALAAALHQTQAAFVCTSPCSHEAIALDCLGAGLHVFTEINLLGHWYDAALALAAQNHCKIFCSSTFLYRREIEYIVQRVETARVNYIYHTGQYLPDWHPWESYKDFFVGDVRTNGCREIFAIELPWLIQAFGDVRTCNVLYGKDSTLDIAYPDTYMATFEHANGTRGTLCVDIVSPHPTRRLEIFAPGLQLRWDGTPDSLYEYAPTDKKFLPIALYETVQHQDGYSPNIVENAYAHEIADFLGYLEGTVEPRHSFAADANILALIDSMEAGWKKSGMYNQG